MNLKIEYLNVDELKPYNRNTRLHKEKDIGKIRQSIEKYGFNDPIGIWKDNIIIEGHGRLEAAMSLGMTEVPVIHLDHLSDKERREYAIAHNRTAEFSEWDMEMLKAEFDELDFEGFDLEMDFSDFEDTPEVVEDDYTEPDDLESRAQLGQIWKLGRHRLMCGDSTDPEAVKALMEGRLAELTFTDPPYELDTQGGGLFKHSNSMNQIKENGVDTFDPAKLVLYSDTNIFCHNKPLLKAYIELAEKNKKPYDLCFYKKINTTPNYGGHMMTDCEYIAIIGDQSPNKGLDKELYSKCFIGQKDADNELSYSKPIGLCLKYILLYSKNNVLDLFGGSGSTLIACEQAKRNCYMMELNEHYCDVIIDRWEQFTGKKAELIG